jgi:hypothetical protein
MYQPNKQFSDNHCNDLDLTCDIRSCNPAVYRPSCQYHSLLPMVPHSCITRLHSSMHVNQPVILECTGNLLFTSFCISQSAHYWQSYHLEEKTAYDHDQKLTGGYKMHQGSTMTGVMKMTMVKQLPQRQGGYPQAKSMPMTTQSASADHGIFFLTMGTGRFS